MKTVFIAVCAFAAGVALRDQAQDLKPAHAQSCIPEREPTQLAALAMPLECKTWVAKCGVGKPCKPRYTCAADLTRRKDRS